MEKLTISEIKETSPANPGKYSVNGQITTIYQKLTKSGNPYYELEIADSSGSMPGTTYTSHTCRPYSR